MRRLTSLFMLLAAFATVSWGQELTKMDTETIQFSTDVNNPEHLYRIKNGVGYWMNGRTSPTGDLDNAALFAFYKEKKNNSTSLTKIDVCWIKCQTSNTWLSYEMKGNYTFWEGWSSVGGTKGYVQLVDSKDKSNFWNIENPKDGKDEVGSAYTFQLYKWVSPMYHEADKYMNWFRGVGTEKGYSLNGTTTVGVYDTDGTGDAGSAWLLFRDPKEVRDAYAQWVADNVGDAVGKYYLPVANEALHATAYANLQKAFTETDATAYKNECIGYYKQRNGIDNSVDGKYYRIKSIAQGTYMGIEGSTFDVKYKEDNAGDPTTVWEYVVENGTGYLRNVYSGLYLQGIASTGATIGNDKSAFQTVQVTPGSTECTITIGGQQPVVDANGNVTIGNGQYHYNIYKVDAPAESRFTAWYGSNPMSLMATPAKVELTNGAVQMFASGVDNATINRINSDIAQFETLRNPLNHAGIINLYAFQLGSDLKTRLTAYAANPILSIDYTAKYEWGTVVMPADFPKPEEWTLYTCGSMTGAVLDLVEANAGIEKRVPYVIGVTEGKRYQFMCYTSDAATPEGEDDCLVQVEGNLLTGALQAGTNVPEGSYVLAKYQYSAEMGFYRVAVGTRYPASPNKCYLTVPDEYASRYNALFFGDIETGIDNVTEAEEHRNSHVIYNMAGQRLNKMQRGLNIVNGKVVVK